MKQWMIVLKTAKMNVDEDFFSYKEKQHWEKVIKYFSTGTILGNNPVHEAQKFIISSGTVQGKLFGEQLKAVEGVVE